MPTHKWKRIEAPWGGQADIDRGIVKLIRLIWELDIRTLFSCENHEGWVDVAVPDAATAVKYWRAGNYALYPDRRQEESLLKALTLVHATAVRIEDELRLLSHLTIRYWPDWQFYVTASLVYCSFPVEKLAKVESNLQLALPWDDPQSDAPAGAVKEACPECESEEFDEHDCLESLQYRELDCSDNVDPEVDGAIARWREQWWECTRCGEKFTSRELEAIQARTEAAR